MCLVVIVIDLITALYKDMQNTYSLFRSHNSVKKSLPCDLQKIENGIGRRPESNTACIPIQLNNGPVVPLLS